MSSETDLDRLFEEASQGDKDSARAFLRAFLELEVVVPDRYQKRALTNQPEYPSPVFALLGIKETDRVIVPCFASSIHLLKWSPEALVFSRVPVKQLLTRVPDGWWLVLNPSNEVSKEFSPWEIERLRGGEANLEEVVTEIFSDAPTRPLEVAALENHEATPLVKALGEIGNTIPEAKKIFVLRETSMTAEDEKVTGIIVGVLTPGVTEARLSEIEATIQNAAERTLIGSDSVRVTCGSDLEGLALSAFKESSPVWERKGVLERLISSFLGRS